MKYCAKVRLSSTSPGIDMVWRGRCIASHGGRVKATSGRKKKDGVHIYPTATLRLPANPLAVNEWRVRIKKRQHAIAVGVSCSTLEPGRVLGRDMSRGLAWWLTPDGEVFDGEHPIDPPHLSLSLSLSLSPTRRQRQKSIGGSRH